MSEPFALKLMKDELNAILHSFEHSKPTDQATDEELALRQLKKEIEAEEAAYLDHKLAINIARVPRQDALLISRICREEERSRTDRQLALRLSGSDMPPNLQPSVEPQNREMLGRVIAQHTKSSAVGSDSDASGYFDKADFTCVACQERDIYFNLVQMPCSHCYCRTCLIQLFEASLRDDSLFPPQCCRKVIPLNTVRTLIGVSISQKVVAKAIERNDVARTYCFQPTCSAYIFPYQRDGKCGTCPDCGEKTCVICKEKIHKGKCVEKVPDEVLLLAETQNWKRCSGCKHMVELVTGCNHITCRCRYQFCYVCGKQWRTCTCPQFDETRLLERAHDIAAQDGAEPNTARVSQVLQRLRLRHDCNHGFWTKRDGHFRCENCRGMLYEYIYECTRCELRTCRRCRFNRAL